MLTTLLAVLGAASVFTAVWLAIGLAYAHRLQPKVARLAFLVLGSAALWPLTWLVERRKHRPRNTVSGRVMFADEVTLDD